MSKSERCGLPNSEEPRAVVRSAPKLLFLTTRLPPAVDGVGDYTVHLARHLARLEPSATVGILALAGDVAPVDGLCVSSLRGNTGVGGLLRALRALRVFKPDVLFWQYGCFAYGRAGIALEWAFFPMLTKLVSGTTVVVTGHELFFDFGRRGWKGLLWAAVQRGELALIRLTSRGFIVTTADRFRWLAALLPKRHAALWRVPVGSNIEPVNDAEEECRTLCSRLGADGETRLLGTFGTLNHHPSIVSVIQSLPRIMDRHPVRLVCLGVRDEAEPNWRAAMAEADRLGVRECIITHHVLPADAVSRYLATLDIYLAIYQDGSSHHLQGASGRRTTLVSAFAHGLATISTTGHEFDGDIFHHGENIWLLPPRPSLAAIADAVVTLLGNEALRQRLADAARATYGREFDWERLAASYQNILHQVSFRSPPLATNPRSRARQ